VLLKRTYSRSVDALKREGNHQEVSMKPPFLSEDDDLGWP
jgi:hypothetical protein